MADKVNPSQGRVQGTLRVPPPPKPEGTPPSQGRKQGSMPRVKAEETSDTGVASAYPDMQAQGLNAYGSYQFRVFITTEYGGVASDVNQSFVRVSGVVTTSEDIAYMRGTDTSVGSAPGRTKFDDLQMERIFNGVDDFYKWRRRIEGGQMELGNLAIEMLDRGGQVVRRIICADAWPKRWEMPEMDSNSSNLAMEKITLAVADIYEDDV